VDRSGVVTLSLREEPLTDPGMLAMMTTFGGDFGRYQKIATITQGLPPGIAKAKSFEVRIPMVTGAARHETVGAIATVDKSGDVDRLWFDWNGNRKFDDAERLVLVANKSRERVFKTTKTLDGMPQGGVMALVYDRSVAITPAVCFAGEFMSTGRRVRGRS
jgi:hypothetical protein